MMRDKSHFHPLSPVQPDKRNPLPLVVLAIVAAAVAWDARDSLAPKAAPNGSSPGKESAGPHEARANLTGLFSADDYPIDALRKNEQGATRVRLNVNPKGRVTGCTVIETSGSSSLDGATCDILARRARFAPAHDVNGNAVADTYEQKIVWQLQ